ncbi:MAG TPA: hypothetical protein VI980_12940 [Acidimicrobiia bacterium]|nr:hypothetical protein [Acidimicrobiia bacterium]
MNEFHIDPSQGPDAAADATNDQLETLLRILMWELAMRTSKEQFDQHLNQLAKARAEMDDDLENARNKREQRRFVAEVLRDLEKLPVVGETTSEPSTGLYL